MSIKIDGGRLLLAKCEEMQEISIFMQGGPDVGLDVTLRLDFENAGRLAEELCRLLYLPPDDAA